MSTRAAAPRCATCGMPLPPEAASCAVCGARVPLIARPDLARRASDGATTGRRTAVPSPPLRDDDGRVADAPLTRRDLRDDLPAPVARRVGDPGSGPVPFGPAVRRRAVEPAPAPAPPSVGRRVLAQLADLGVAGVGAGAAAGAATLAGAPPLAAAGTAALLVAAAQVVAEGVTGATAGAAALGLRTVTHATGGSPGVGRALVRQLVLGLGALLLLVGTVLVAASAVFDRGAQRRGWHDRASGTRVVDAATPPSARVPAASPGQGRPAPRDGGARGDAGPATGAVRGAASPAGGTTAAAPRTTPDAGGGAGDLPQPSTPPSAIPLTAARPADDPWRDAVVTEALPAAPPPSEQPPSDPVPFVATPPDPPASVATRSDRPPSDAAPSGALPSDRGTAVPPMPEPLGAGTPVPGTPVPHAPVPGAPPAPWSAPAAPAPEPRAPLAPGALAGADALRSSADALEGTDPRPSAPVAATSSALHDELVELEHTRVRDPAQLRRRSTTLALLFDTGPRVRVVGRGLAGRGPRAEDGADILHVVAVDDPSRSVSRVHLEFGPQAPDSPDAVAGVWVLDRGSTNGTVVVAPDGDARVLPAGTRAVVRAGWTVRLGERVVRVEDD